MVGLNHIILTGRLAQDPELRYTADKMPVARFALAVGRPKKKGEDNGADFINCVSFRRLAEIVNEYLKKGKLIAVEGRLQIKKYESKGKTRTATEVLLNNLQMLDRKFYDSSAAAEEKIPEITPAEE